ncbi:hypothetical protein ABKN59_004537 [Abortiporus biennis]
MSAIKSEYHNFTSFISTSISHAMSLDIAGLLSPSRFMQFIFNIFYILVQRVIIFLFRPASPKRSDQPTNPKGRIAVVGAGLTGISSAAHAIAHGFDVVIFEKDNRTGGIWSHVNSTSGLQLNSLLYRFHPAVLWSGTFPLRDEILGEINYVWKTYKLDSRTRFKTEVTSVHRVDHDSEGNKIQADDLDPSKRGHARWVINDGSEGVFDAVIVTVGTCGKPRWVKFDGMPSKEDLHHNEEHQAASEDDNEAGETEGIDLAEQEQAQAQAPRKSAWSKPDSGQVPIQVITLDQEIKKADNFPTPTEAYFDAASSLSGSVSGTEPTTPKATDRELDDDPGRKTTAWHNSPPQPPPAVLKADQEAKKATQFPTPAEAYPITPTSSAPSSPVITPKAGSKHEKQGEGSVSDHGDTEDDDVYTKGTIVHSSELDELDAGKIKGGKKVVVIGSGASGVEAVEAILDKAEGEPVDIVILAREDKWVIPRNMIIDTLISAQPFGRQMPLSFLWEKFILLLNYRGVTDLAPADKGLFESTPVVNDTFLQHVRNKKCLYVRGDTLRLTKNGVKVNVRQRGTKPGDKGEEKVFDADIIVFATGYEKPDVGFLEKELFPEGYERPNLYLQNFCTEDWSILLTNSAYVNAIGTVGHFHIGIYTRILLTFLMDKDARPTPKDMKLWVDVIRFLKRGAKGGALGFFTYMELTIWLLLFHVLRPDRLRWMFFIMQGWGVSPKEYYT